MRSLSFLCLVAISSSWLDVTTAFAPSGALHTYTTTISTPSRSSVDPPNRHLMFSKKLSSVLSFENKSSREKKSSENFSIIPSKRKQFVTKVSGHFRSKKCYFIIFYIDLSMLLILSKHFVLLYLIKKTTTIFWKFRSCRKPSYV
jgi:hypothetical protein